MIAPYSVGAAAGGPFEQIPDLSAKVHSFTVDANGVYEFVKTNTNTVKSTSWADYEVNVKAVAAQNTVTAELEALAGGDWTNATVQNKIAANLAYVNVTEK